MRNPDGVTALNCVGDSPTFVSLSQIVRNLMERYNAGPAIAEIIGIDTSTDDTWRYSVAYEVSHALIVPLQFFF